MRIGLYYYPLLFLPTVIDAPGEYRTRGGGRVTIKTASPAPMSADCTGAHENGVLDHWHRSGRIYAGMLSLNDIVARA